MLNETHNTEDETRFKNRIDLVSNIFLGNHKSFNYGGEKYNMVLQCKIDPEYYKYVDKIDSPDVSRLLNMLDLTDC